ncbi:MAG: hypothetical protein H7256_05400 [Bdellovibrio sp.]|nr:hypothetical protein [Bdellovibrio sp.]
MPKIKIYAGLSVSEKIVKKYLPQAQFSKPIKRNDLYDDLKNGVQVIGIIDGEFLQSLSVSPTEIHDVLRCGVSVYGASSMGAMRAAELSEYGMVGCGEIFEHIQSDSYFRDDKLGQIYFEGMGIESIPFVDFYMGAKGLVRRGVVSKAHANLLIEVYLDLHFSRRNFSSLEAIVRKHANGAKLLISVKKIRNQMVYQKRADGISLLKHIAKNLALHDKQLRLLF